MIDYEAIADAVLGTCQTEAAIIDRYDLVDSTDELLDRLLDFGVETCLGCGWWVESGDMVEAEHGDMVCSDCGRGHV